MSAPGIIHRQVEQIRRGGRPVFHRKLRKSVRLAFAPLVYVLAVPVVIVVRLLIAWFPVRLGSLRAPFGHFAINTELYLCERDAGINQPARRPLDLIYMEAPVSNQQLAVMWKRVLNIWPEWILAPIRRVDRLVPGNPIPACGVPVQEERDVYNLLDRFAPHLAFTPEEEVRGEAGLRALGVPEGRRFVCLNVRDNAWNANEAGVDPSSFANDEVFRDCDIQNYVLAAETLADRGYCVIRVGAIVREAIGSGHPGVVDYASNGMRSDFMDVYLGAKCAFCISGGSGFDGVPTIFRRPLAFVNFVPVGGLDSHSANILGITKHHLRTTTSEILSLEEIFSLGAGYGFRASDYQANGIRLVENTPEEIRDLVVEMAERLEGTWRPHDEDGVLQKRFWEILTRYSPPQMPEYDQAQPWHGEIRARFGAAFLRANRAWLD